MLNAHSRNRSRQIHYTSIRFVGLVLLTVIGSGCGLKPPDSFSRKVKPLMTQVVSASWSYDGARIGLIVGSNLNPWKRFIGTCAADGDNFSRMNQEAFWDGRVVWSRDQASVFTTARSGATSQIWQIPLGGMPPVQLTSLGGMVFHCALDNESIYFLSNRDDYPALYRLRLRDKSVTQLSTLLPPVALPAIDAQDEYLLYCASEGDRYSLRCYRLISGEEFILATVEAPVRDLWWDNRVQRFCFISGTASGDCLMVGALHDEAAVIRPFYCSADSTISLQSPAWSVQRKRTLVIEGITGRLLLIKNGKE